MKVYSYSEARQKLAEVLNKALTEEVLIKRKNGETFSVARKENVTSPFDVPGIKTQASTSDILKAIKESRSRG